MNDPANLYAALRRDDELPIRAAELPSHVKTDALEALAIKPRHCMGESCRQGRSPCTDRCGAEMGSGEPDPYPGFWRALLAFLSGSKPY